MILSMRSSSFPLLQASVGKKQAAPRGQEAGCSAQQPLSPASQTCRCPSPSLISGLPLHSWGLLSRRVSSPFFHITQTLRILLNVLLSPDIGCVLATSKAVSIHLPCLNHPPHGLMAATRPSSQRRSQRTQGLGEKAAGSPHGHDRGWQALFPPTRYCLPCGDPEAEGRKKPPTPLGPHVGLSTLMCFSFGMCVLHVFLVFKGLLRYSCHVIGFTYSERYALQFCKLHL